jgi:chromosome segregation ATPase
MGAMSEARKKYEKEFKDKFADDEKKLKELREKRVGIKETYDQILEDHGELQVKINEEENNYKDVKNPRVLMQHKKNMEKLSKELEKLAKKVQNAKFALSEVNGDIKRIKDKMDRGHEEIRLRHLKEQGGK